jgi:hypothetical protein
MKVCSTCHQLKPLDSFNLLRRAKDGRQARCRECCRDWYVEHAAQHKANVRARNDRAREELRLRIVDYFRAHPCVDCGETDLRCLEFDHEPGRGKSANVGDLLRMAATWSRIEREIAKCEVRCANCHRRRTVERGGHWRQAVQEQDTSSRHGAAAARLAGLAL